MTEPLQVFWKTPKHVFVRRDNVIVQVRADEQTVAALEAEELGLRLTRAQVPTGPIGAFLVIEEGAPAPVGEVAERQRELVSNFASEERMFVCVVMEGAGTGVALKRTLARALFRGPRRFICGTVRDGAKWLAGMVGGQPEDLVSFVDSVRPR